MKTRKLFRKPLAILMAALMFIQLSGMSFAVGDEVFVEVIFSCDIDYQKAQLITDILIGENSGFIGIAPASSCNHIMAQTTSRTIEHRYFTTAPRCRQTTYRVDYCTRQNCTYTIMTQISQIAIFCCS